MMSLSGHSILIVESEVASFVVALQAAIERTGAESLVVRDPSTSEGLERIRRFKFSAAVINILHRSLIDDLDIPVLVYGGSAIPARPDMIVAKLRRLLEHFLI